MCTVLQAIRQLNSTPFIDLIKSTKHIEILSIFHFSLIKRQLNHKFFSDMAVVECIQISVLKFNLTSKKPREDPGIIVEDNCGVNLVVYKLKFLTDEEVRSFLNM